MAENTKINKQPTFCSKTLFLLSSSRGSFVLAFSRALRASPFTSYIFTDKFFKNNATLGFFTRLKKRKIQLSVIREESERSTFVIPGPMQTAKKISCNCYQECLDPIQQLEGI